MQLIRPFRGLRVVPDRASEVAAPPYDVMNTEEARRMVDGKPDSFLHVSRPEIDLEPGISLYDDACYQKAAENFDRLQATGAMVRDDTENLYLYRLTFDGRSQLGIAAEVAVQAYLDGRVKKHEFTRPDKEDDRTRHIDAIDANSGPVFLVYRQDPDLDSFLTEWTEQNDPVIDLAADDNVRHEFWVVSGRDDIQRIVGAIDARGALYIADGHHRCAAAARVCQARGTDQPGRHDGFFGVLFPHNQTRVYDYNRVVSDLNGLDETAFLDAIGDTFDVDPSDGPVRPDRPNTFGMFIGGSWYRLAIDDKLVDRNDPVRRLDVALLADYLLEPVLGISDPRRDKRIDFVGGIRGLGELERRVAAGAAVAFSLFPTSLDDLMAVADAGQVMPPKSTWFEPKLRDGLLAQLLSD